MINILLFFFLVVLGLVVGSFLNVVVYRLNHGKSPLVGRSFCPKCKHQLAWKDNLPLLSFALLRGCCRYCHSPISWQYPIVELTTAGLTVLIFRHLQFDNLTIRNLLIAYSLLAVFVSDLRYMIIPDEVVAFAAVVTLVSSISVSNIVAATGAAAFFGLLALLTKGRGMGIGDVKLVGLMGLILGWPQILIALFLAFLTGAITGVILILVGKKKFGQQVPFGPFLTAATLISLLWGQSILAYYLAWF